MDTKLLDDDDRLLRCNDARKFLADMPISTFYLNIERGIIPRQRYLGATPVWRLGDLREVIKQLPGKPYSADDRNSSR